MLNTNYALNRKMLFKGLYICLLLLGLAVIMFMNNSLWAYAGVTPMILFLDSYIHFIGKWKAYGYSPAMLNILLPIYTLVMILASGLISRLIVYFFDYAFGM